MIHGIWHGHKPVQSFLIKLDKEHRCTNDLHHPSFCTFIGKTVSSIRRTEYPHVSCHPLILPLHKCKIPRISRICFTLILTWDLLPRIELVQQ